MHYQALYRKYRPKNFDEVVDQEYVVKVLINSLKYNSVSHAYVFSGPRGTGKTTIAKILAKSVNCLDLKEGMLCNKCDSCKSFNDNSNLDIIEMDAASNNSVEEVRDLRSKVNLVPATSKYKVYIIDEVHMLTSSAFNALLKTLEEPPEHVIFILATTELHKIPSTILSRCQCFEFGRISNSNLLKKLREVSDIEKISVDDDVLKEITIYADGGMRDALGMLDKLSSYNKDKIDMSCFLKINNILSDLEIESFIDYIINNKRKIVVDKMIIYEDSGIDILKFVERLIYKLKDIITTEYLNNKVTEKTQKMSELAITLNNIYIKMHNSVSPKIVLELELLIFMSNFDDVILEKTNEVKSDKELAKVIISKQTFEQTNLDLRINNAFSRADKEKLSLYKNLWESSFREYILNNEYGAVACILIDAIPRVASEEYLIISVKYAAIIENVNYKIEFFEKFIEKIFNRKIKLGIITEEEWDIAKNNFINNKKNNIQYEYKEELDNIKKDMVENNKSNLVTENEVEEIINLLGEDIVQLEE